MLGLRENHVDNIHCRKAGQESAGGQENQQQRADDPHHAALFLFCSFYGGAQAGPRSGWNEHLLVWNGEE